MFSLTTNGRRGDCYVTPCEVATLLSWSARSRRPSTSVCQRMIRKCWVRGSGRSFFTAKQVPTVFYFL